MGIRMSDRSHDPFEWPIGVGGQCTHTHGPMIYGFSRTRVSVPHRIARHAFDFSVAPTFGHGPVTWSCSGMATSRAEPNKTGPARLVAMPGHVQGPTFKRRGRVGHLHAPLADRFIFTRSSPSGLVTLFARPYPRPRRPYKSASISPTPHGSRSAKTRPPRTLGFLPRNS